MEAKEFAAIMDELRVRDHAVWKRYHSLTKVMHLTLDNEFADHESKMIADWIAGEVKNYCEIS